jgi:hypothetical protein
MSEHEINQKVAEEICSTFRLNGQEFHRGECVGLLDGKVIAVTKDLMSAVLAVHALDPDPKRGMAFEVAPLGVDYIR